jgi:hypothetical protein
VKVRNRSTSVKVRLIRSVARRRQAHKSGSHAEVGRFVRHASRTISRQNSFSRLALLTGAEQVAWKPVLFALLGRSS